MEILNKIKGLDTKVKILGVIAIVLLFVIVVSLINNSSTSSNNETYDNYYQDDNFGNNEEVTAVQKEDIVAETPDIEVVILSKKFGGDTHGYIEITNATVSVDGTFGDAVINVEGIKGGHGRQKTDGTYWYSNPPIEYRVYDANGTLLWSNNIYVDNYENKEQGDICKGSAWTYVDANKVARIEIG